MILFYVFVNTENIYDKLGLGVAIQKSGSDRDPWIGGPLAILMRKTLLEREKNAGNRHFLLFPHFFYPFKIEIGILATLNTLSANAFNSFLNKPLFLRVCSSSLLKTLWEKEKLFITSNFSFSRNVCYPLRGLSTIFFQF